MRCAQVTHLPSIGIHGCFFRNPTKPRGCPWISYRRPWQTHGRPWAYHGNPWAPTVLPCVTRRHPWVYHGIRYATVGAHESDEAVRGRIYAPTVFSLVLMGVHGSPMDRHGLRWMFIGLFWVSHGNDSRIANPPNHRYYLLNISRMLEKRKNVITNEFQVFYCVQRAVER